jgi:hypothetical protein
LTPPILVLVVVAGIFLAIGKQTLASKEASYSFGADRKAKPRHSFRMSTEPSYLINHFVAL